MNYNVMYKLSDWKKTSKHQLCFDLHNLHPDHGRTCRPSLNRTKQFWTLLLHFSGRSQLPKWTKSICYVTRKNGIRSVQQDEVLEIRVFTARCTTCIVQSAVLRLHVVRPSVCLSVCNICGSGSHKLEILRTNCTGKILAKHLRSS